MVESIGAGSVNGDRGVARVAAATPATPAAAVTQPAAQPSSSQGPAAAEAGALARSLAASAPVDTDRVAKIKRAIATGSFPILPATIADRLMALRLEWNSSDAA